MNPIASAISKFKQQVYVDVPASPYPLSRYSSLNKPFLVYSDLKADAPLISLHGKIAHSTSEVPTRKRKVSENEIPASTSTLGQKKKKQKLIDVDMILPTSNACPDYPNGFIYCHQCAKKRHASDAIYCTVTETITNSKKRTAVKRKCAAKFCKTCLKNRYGEDVDKIKSQGINIRQTDHFDNLNYTFQCPKCRDICNCARCRKSKGLEPTGNLTHIARKTGSASAAQFLTDDSKAIGIMPNKGAQKDNKPKLKDSVISQSSKPSRPTKKTPVSKMRKLEPLPLLNWTAIPTNLSLQEVESRFRIREFILRFAPIMEPAIPKSLLVELDEISRDRGDDNDLTGWISEACVRAIVLGMLGMLVNKDDSIEEPVKCAIKDIRATGVNLNKIWVILARLRKATGDVSNHSSNGILTFPDPLPPPVSAFVYNTRTTRSARDSSGVDHTTIISHPAQMIPVIEALVEAAFDTDIVREELDRGIKEGKEIIRGIKECTKAENERWDAEKKEFESLSKDTIKGGQSHYVKVKRQAHKHYIQNLENTLKLVLPGLAPRFLPLGTDGEGRIFWALSPGNRERKIAMDYITSMVSGSKEQKKRQRGHVLDGDGRSAKKQWSWCVIVWGKLPSGSTISSSKQLPNADITDHEDASKDGDKDVERWWAFYEPKEIQKVAHWIDITARAQSDGETDNNPASSLAKALKDYAALVEWRQRDDKYEADTSEDPSNS